MRITVDSRLRDTLVPEATVTIEVRADDPPATLTQALSAAGADIAAGGPPDSGGPRYVSRPVPVLGAQLMIIDLGTMSEDRLRGIPERIAARLREAGVERATIGRADEIGDRYLTVQAFAPAARATLRGPLGTPLGEAPQQPPYRLRDIAVQWLDGVRRPESDILSVVMAAEIPVARAELADVTSAVLDAGRSVAFLATDFASEVASAGVVGALGDLAPQASLTASGTAWTPADVAEAMRGQRAAVRAAAADLIWAGVTAEPDARDVLVAQWSGRGPSGGRPPIDLVADVLVPDVMWYMVLSAGHLDRLGGTPEGAVAAPGGRVDLTIGEPEQWLPGHPDQPTVRAAARAALGPCLAAPEEAFELVRQRIALLNRGRS